MVHLGEKTRVFKFFKNPVSFDALEVTSSFATPKSNKIAISWKLLKLETWLIAHWMQNIGFYILLQYNIMS